MSFLAPIIGALVSGGLGMLTNSQNQQAQQQAQQTSQANQTKDITLANQLDQQNLQAALARYASYVQQNPNPLYGMAQLQAPNQTGPGVQFGGGTIQSPGSPGGAQSLQNAQQASMGQSNPLSTAMLMQSLAYGQPNPQPSGTGTPLGTAGAGSGSPPSPTTTTGAPSAGPANTTGGASAAPPVRPPQAGIGGQALPSSQNVAALLARLGNIGNSGSVPQPGPQGVSPGMLTMGGSQGGNGLINALMAQRQAAPYMRMSQGIM